MSAKFERLRGYVAPFNSVGAVDGTYEKFAPGTFAGMFAAMPPIDLRWASHSDGAARLASTTRATLSLFVDEYGLGFEAQIDMSNSENWNRIRHITQKNDPMAFASVGGLVIKGKRWEKFGCAKCRVITEATISHITITDRSAAYQATAVWPAVPLDDAPWKIRELAARWGEGRAAWDRKQQIAARAATPQRHRSASEAKLAAFLAPRQREFTNYRRNAMAMMFSRGAAPVIFAHVAFTRAGGFDGDWSKLGER